MPYTVSVDRILRRDKDFMQGVYVLLSTKSSVKSWLKFAEELGELHTKILQAVNKDQLNNWEVIDGIVEEYIDVSMHMILIGMMLKFGNVLPEVREKVNKMLNSKDFNKYYNLWLKEQIEVQDGL